MPSQALAISEIDIPGFPAAEVERRLRAELQEIADDASLLRPEWEPLLDSQRVVGVVLALEDLFPSCKIPPDRVVRRGGYDTVDDAIADMVPRINHIVTQDNQPRRRK